MCHVHLRISLIFFISFEIWHRAFGLVLFAKIFFKIFFNKNDLSSFELCEQLPNVFFKVRMGR